MQRSQAAASFERYLAADPTTGDRAEIEHRIAALRTGPSRVPASGSAGPAVVAPSAEGTASREVAAEKPLHKQGWLWGVVGGSAAVVVLAVILGVTVGGGDGPRTLQPVPLQ